MKILIIGDTHGADDLFATIKRKETPFEMLLHVGDVEGKNGFMKKCAAMHKYYLSKGIVMIIQTIRWIGLSTLMEAGYI